MLRRGTAALALVLGVVLLGCSTGLRRQPLESSVKPPSFHEVLEEARRNPQVRRQLVLEAEGHLAEGISSLLVFGDGVAVLNGRRQFRVADETLVTILDLLIARGVAAWPEESPLPEGNALEIHRRLLVSIDQVSHLVIERNKRPPRPPLQELLRDIALLVQPAAAEGVEVSSLEEGLRLIAAGVLAPQVLTVNALAPGLPGAAGGATDGWQLTLQRGVLQASAYRLPEGVRPASRRTAPAEAAGLAQLLLEAGAARLPRQVHLEEGLFQLHIEVLGQRLAVQARRFAGKGATQGLEARDALLAVRDQLRRRFDAETRAAATTGAGG